MEPPKSYDGKATSNKCVSSLLQKVATVSEDLIVHVSGSRFLIAGAVLSINLVEKSV